MGTRPSASRLDLFTVQFTAIRDHGVDSISQAGSLHVCVLDKHEVHDVVVAVDHEGVPAPQVDVLLPPVAHVVGCPPGLEYQVLLQPGGSLLLELLGQRLHSIILLIIQQVFHGFQVPMNCGWHAGHRQLGQRRLEAVEHGPSARQKADADSPDSGQVAGLAVHLKHPTVVGKKQFQGLAKEEDAHHPDARGEDGHAEERPGVWGPVGTSLRKPSLDIIDQSHGNVHVVAGGTHCCHNHDQPAGGAARVHTP